MAREDYDELASDYQEHRETNPEVLKSILASSGLTPKSRVLEVGSGTGNYITAIQEATGCRAWGVDPSNEMLAAAREAGSRVNFAWGRGETLRFEDDFFDLVFSVDVIHHVRGREEYHREAHRVLRPGGLVCTVTDNEWIIRNRIPLSAYFPDTVERELERYPDETDLRNEMAWVGFRDLRREVVEHHYDLDDLGPYRAKAFSSLHLIEQGAWERGLRRMELDMGIGPLPCVARYLLLWGRR
jgi:SAM-dependent methyltransferase